MRRIILSALMLMSFAFGAQAQKISKNAIGLRLASDDGIGIDASYQRAIFKSNRLEFNLGIRERHAVDAVKFAALYQWVFPIDNGFNWYVGAGGGLGSYKVNHKGYDYYYFNGYYYDGRYTNDDGVFAYAAGVGGIEYNFDIPLMISFDIRPEVGGNTYYDNHIGADIGLAVRYQF